MFTLNWFCYALATLLLNNQNMSKDFMTYRQSEDNTEFQLILISYEKECRSLFHL